MCFLFQQRALAIHAPAIAGQAAIVADNAVARNGNREGVRSVRLGYGPHRARGADTVCDVCVARSRARRNFVKRLPNTLLERIAANIQRQSGDLPEHAVEAIRARTDALCLQGRKPAFSASSHVGWKRTFSGRASRAAHEGRQYTPVVLTE